MHKRDRVVRLLYDSQDFYMGPFTSVCAVPLLLFRDGPFRDSYASTSAYFTTLFQQLPPGLPLPGWAEIRQWAYSTQIPLYKDGDTSPSLVFTGSLGLIDMSYRDREIGVSPVGPTLAAAWG